MSFRQRRAGLFTQLSRRLERAGWALADRIGATVIGCARAANEAVLAATERANDGPPVSPHAVAAALVNASVALLDLAPLRGAAPLGDALGAVLTAGIGAHAVATIVATQSDGDAPLGATLARSVRHAQRHAGCLGGARVLAFYCDVVVHGDDLAAASRRQLPAAWSELARRAVGQLIAIAVPNLAIVSRMRGAVIAGALAFGFVTALEHEARVACTSARGASIRPAGPHRVVPVRSMIGVRALAA